MLPTFCAKVPPLSRKFSVKCYLWISFIVWQKVILNFLLKDTRVSGNNSSQIFSSKILHSLGRPSIILQNFRKMFSWKIGNIFSWKILHWQNFLLRDPRLLSKIDRKIYFWKIHCLAKLRLKLHDCMPNFFCKSPHYSSKISPRKIVNCQTKVPIKEPQKSFKISA